MKITFVLISGELFYGPFKTADAAAKWAKKNLASRTWRIASMGMY